MSQKSKGLQNLLITKLAGPLGNSPVGIGGLAVTLIPVTITHVPAWFCTTQEFTPKCV